MTNKTDNAQLTQGPWFVWNDGVYAGTPTEKTSGRLVGYTNKICTVDADVSEISEEEADAILFLLAAAPALKAELQSLVDQLLFVNKELFTPIVASAQITLANSVGMASLEGGAA